MIWEFKKIWKWKAMWLFLVLFLMLNAYSIRQRQRRENLPLDGHEELAARIQGKITNEKIRFVTEYLREVTEKIQSGESVRGEYDPDMYTGYAYGDQNEFQEWYDRLSYCFFYESEIRTIQSRAEAAEKRYQELGNQRGVKECRLIRRLYGGRALTEYWEMERIEQYLEYDFSEIFILLLVVLTAPALIARDRSAGIAEVIGTAETSLSSYLLKKAGALVLFIVLISVVFGFQDYWMWGMFSEADKMGQPLYAIESCREGMMAVSVRGFLSICFAARTMSYVCIGFGILLLALWMKKPLYSTAAAVLGVGALAVLSLYDSGVWNPVGLLGLFEQQKEFQAVVLAGAAMPLFLANLICCGIWCLLLLGALAVSAKRIKDLG